MADKDWSKPDWYDTWKTKSEEREKKGWVKPHWWDSWVERKKQKEEEHKTLKRKYSSIVKNEEEDPDEALNPLERSWCNLNQRFKTIVRKELTLLKLRRKLKRKNFLKGVLDDEQRYSKLLEEEEKESPTPSLLSEDILFLSTDEEDNIPPIHNEDLVEE